MPERRRAGHRVAGILVVAVLVTATVIAIRYAVRGSGRSGASSVSLTFNENSPLAELNKALADRDHRCIAIVEGRATPKPGVPQTAYTEAEAPEWIETLAALASELPEDGRAALE